MKSSSLSFLFSSFLLFAARIHACDLCGCYLPPQEHIPQSTSGLYVGVSEQFTHFGSIRIDGREVNDPAGQYLDSSITQLAIGSTFFDRRFSLQVNVPLISRSYKRPEGFATDRGNESGLGDISLLANVVIFKTGALARDTASAANFGASFNLLAGVKLPTGDSSRIREEFAEVEVEGAPESGIHGHDLTLGTGSYDAVFGAQFALRYRAAFFQADTQFTLRGDGLHEYHFANDLSWSGGPGIEILRDTRGSLAVQCALSGEHKDTDRFQGRVAGDTGITTLFVGPRVTAQYGWVNGELGLDLPVLIDNTALQAVPDYRIRAAVSIRF